MLLLSTSLNQFIKMLADSTRSTGKLVLKIHADKTKILSNQKTNKQREVQIDNFTVQKLTPIGEGEVSGTN